MSNKLIADLMSFRARLAMDKRSEVMFEGDFDAIDEAIATLRKSAPVAWRCNGEVSSSSRYIQDVSTQHNAPIEPLYTSPQQSNALEMAAKDKYIEILEKALHRCIYNATFILNNHNQGASILEANEHELLLAITTKEPFTNKPKGILIPQPERTKQVCESDGK